MKPEEIKDLRELLGNIEFANAQLQQATQKLDQFQGIEKLVPILQDIKEIDLGKHIERIDFKKIGDEVFTGVRQSINAQNTIITNSIESLQQNSKDLTTLVDNLQELDEITNNLRDLKKGIKGINLKMIVASLFIGVGVGVLSGYVYFSFIKLYPFQKLLSKRSYIIEESNGFRDILVITAPFQSGTQDGSTWIAFTYPQAQQQTTKKDQK